MCDASCVANERCVWVHCTREGKKEERTEGVVSLNLEKKTAQGPQSCARREAFPSTSKFVVQNGVSDQFHAASSTNSV